MAAPSFNIGSKLNFQGDSALASYQTFGNLINHIVPNLYVFAGIIIFFMIVFGGFMIIANAGNADKTKEGAGIITSAIIGLVVLFAAYWIIQLVEVLTGIQILNGGIL